MKIFSQTKPTFSGYSGVDMVQVEKVLSFYGITINEELYEKISYIEQKYITHYNKTD